VQSNRMRRLIRSIGELSQRRLHSESSLPKVTAPGSGWSMPDWRETVWRGIKGRCPRCGISPIFDGYLKVFKSCPQCAAPLGDMPADDAPPYFAMLIVLHSLAIFIVIFYRDIAHPGLAIAGVLLALLVIITMVTLRVIKGVVIAILLKLSLDRANSNN
jgi:uncharacterized protein (DUF983 family)